MDWTALVGPGALTAGALAAGVIAKTWFDMRRWSADGTVTDTQSR